MKRINAHVQFYQSEFMFIYNDEIINAEILGNILFGFSGNAGGYSLDELCNGGSLYSRFTTGDYDSDDDTKNVKKGFKLYDKYGEEYRYLHIEEK